MSDLKVLIVGASIAGPMAAYWFAKAGADVTVIERFPELRSGGQNIDIRLTGVTVMRKIPGMEEAVRATLAPEEGFGMVNSKGTPIAIMRGTGNAEQQSLLSEFEIFRGDLSRVIFDLTKDNDKVKYVFGEQIASMEQQGDGPVKVTFINGLPNAEYDLVVACDGATSRTRAMGLECGTRDHINSIGAWVAYFSIKKDLLNGGKVALGVSAPGGINVSVGPDSLPGHNRAMLWSSHQNPDDPGMLEFRQAQKSGEEAIKQLAAKRFTGSGWRTEEVLEGMWKSNDFYASELCQVKTPSLFKGRFVLVGDAGYATGPTGTGTSLAIGGAYVLAGEIHRHKGDLTAGLKAYEERMRPIIKDMQVVPPGVLTFMAPQTAWGISIRNLIFRFVCWGMQLGTAMSWLISFWSAGFGKDKYNLPDYEWSE
ncbi:MAG: hypothetical protein GOMPHAMPRED_002595 [Gomphillus americanus]|uniref:FAD-binding domain-containing protein n=1 Tax=Gomphillus americanus TaxID=1940652 RepID=A0A8H3IIW5_9LECA|nr:MAG: hypothetical protein GOMPHAMPRED_002595 [Gomphillus americanus]